MVNMPYSDFITFSLAILPLNICAAILTAMLVFEWCMDKINDDDDPDAFA